MTTFTRREWNRLALQGIAACALPANSIAQWLVPPITKVNGVEIGIQSYSLRDRPLDAALDAMKQLGITSCELWSGHTEPKDASNEQKRIWRENNALNELKTVRNKFDRAGITISAFTLGFSDKQSDEEMEQNFKMTKALGVNTITSSAKVSIAKRIDALAKKYQIYVGMHNHDNTKNPDEFATPESFAKAMAGASNYIAINLDIGHFVAANYDPVEFMQKHHDRIVMIHVKDRKRDHGDNTVFGQGDTPIKPVLTLMRDNKYKFPANIEYEYDGADAVAEIRKCIDYCKQALV